MHDTITRARVPGVPRPAIATRAFEIYQRRSSLNQHGSSVDDWLQAERELWEERFAEMRRGVSAAVDATGPVPNGNGPLPRR